MIVAVCGLNFMKIIGRIGSIITTTLIVNCPALSSWQLMRYLQLFDVRLSLNINLEW